MLWASGIFFLLMRKAAKRLNKEWGKLLAYGLLALGVFTLAFAPLPFFPGSLASWGAQLANWGLGLLAGVLGASVAVLAGVALIALLVFTVFDLKDKKPDGVAKTTVYLTPVLALVAGGPVAVQLLEIMQSLGGVGPNVLATIT